MNDNNVKNWKKIKEDSEIEEPSAGTLLDDTQLDEELNDKLQYSNAVLDHPSYTELEEKLTFAEQQAHDNREKAMRAVAELDNVRRRLERDVANAHRYGLEKIITSLLPVIDSLEQALQLADKEAQASMVEGLQLTLKLFCDVLEKHGVQQINPEGAIFNPQEHEAMSIQELPNAIPNSIVTVFQKGYKLNDRVIRPARVIVAKTAPTS